VRVLAPEALAEQVADEARAVAEAYEEDRPKNT
jgi:predicted DNA-binding transcriptional regulator YafY